MARPSSLAAAASAILVLGGVLAPAANASDWALNGRYLATSNGDWATTNEVYHDETSVRSVWTIAMTCSDVVTCRGTVDSDVGWSAEIISRAYDYVVRREIPSWEPCADGSGRTVTGHQIYRFYPTAPEGTLLPGSRVFQGNDKTSGETGACSLNETLQIALPFRLEKLE